MKRKRIFRELKVKSLRHYLTFLSLIISIIGTILLLVYIDIQIDTFMMKEYRETGERTLDQSANSIKRNLDNINYIVQATQNNEVIISNLNILENDTSTPINKYRASEQLKDYLFFLSTENKMIEDVLIISSNKQYSSLGKITSYELNGAIIEETISSNHLFTQSLFLENIQLENGQSMVELENEEEYLNNKLFFAINLYDSEKNHRGISIFTINKDFLLESLLASDNYQIMHNDQVVFSGGNFNESKMKNSDIIELNNSEYISDEIYPYGLTVYYNLNTYDKVNLTSFLFLIFIIIVVIYTISYMLSSYVVQTALQPIYNLIEWIKKQEKNRENFNYDQKQKNNRFSFRQRLFSYFFLTILIPIISISGFYYIYASNEILNEILELREAEHESKTTLINTEIDRVRLVLANFAINPELMKNLYIEDNPSLLFSGYAPRLTVESVSVYDQNNSLWFSTSEYNNKKINESNFKGNKLDSRYIFALDKNKLKQDVLFIGLPSLNKPELFKGNGTIVVGIEEHFFNELPLVEMVETESISINDTIYWDISQNVFEEMGTLKKEGKKYHEFQSILNINGWVYHSYLNLNDIKADITGIFLQNSYIYIVIVVILFIMSYFLTNRVLKPFNNILTYSKKGDYKSLESDYFTFIEGFDEIYELRKKFRESIKSLNDLMEEKVELQNYALKEEYAKKEIQLFALQNQVNPHFLYNSLENLLFLVEMGMTDRAVNMISSLAQFFQFVTNRETVHVLLRQEIKFTENYLNIMHERFNNFKVEWNVDPRILDTEVIKLMIQPIVENTIHHGVRHTDKLITLRIKITKFENKIRFIIADDALGIEEEKLREIQCILNDSTFNKSGIFNINDRLNLYYEGSYKFQIDSKLNKGTRVFIEIPIKKNN